MHVRAEWKANPAVLALHAYSLFLHAWLQTKHVDIMSRVSSLATKVSATTSSSAERLPLMPSSSLSRTGQCPTTLPSLARLGSAPLTPCGQRYKRLELCHRPSILFLLPSDARCANRCLR